MTQARLRVGAAEGAQVQGGDQRAVHHQAAVAFGFGDVGPVVMDAVAVEGYGAVAKQQGAGRRDRLAPVTSDQRLAAAGLRRAGLAVDDVLLFADGQLAVLQVVVLHGDEQQRAGAAVLFLDVLDGRYPAGFATHPQWLDELDTAAGPHAVAVVGRRQEATTRRMAVLAQTVLGDRLLKKRPVPQRRQRLAMGRRGFAKGGGDALDQIAAELVVGFFATTDPGGKSRITHGAGSSSVLV